MLFKLFYNICKKLNFIFNKKYNKMEKDVKNKFFYKNYKKKKKIFYKNYNYYLFKIDDLLKNRYKKLFLWLSVILFLTGPLSLYFKIRYGF